MPLNTSCSFFPDVGRRHGVPMDNIVEEEGGSPFAGEFLILISILFLSTTVFANNASVCLRSPDVKAALMELLQKPCEFISMGVQKIESGVFQGLHSVERLVLGAGPLRKLPEDLFWGLKKLRVLSVPQNHITELPPRKYF